jgi:hypothetical protein
MIVLISVTCFILFALIFTCCCCCCCGRCRKDKEFNVNFYGLQSKFQKINNSDDDDEKL